jgi:hypothetical protein
MSAWALSGTRPSLATAVLGFTPTSNAAFESQVAAAILPGAVAPAFLNRGGNPDHSTTLPIEFCQIFAQILAQDQHRI